MGLGSKAPWEKTVTEAILWEKGLPANHGRWEPGSAHRRAAEGRERWRQPGQRRQEGNRKERHGPRRWSQQQWLGENAQAIRPLLIEDGTVGSTQVKDDGGDHGHGGHVSEPQCPLMSPPLGPPVLKPNLQSERKRDRFSTLSTGCHTGENKQATYSLCP